MKAHQFFTHTSVNQLHRVVADMESGHFAVPDFQRDYVWNTEQVVQLADSITRGYPAGQVLLWRRRSPRLLRSELGGVRFHLAETPHLIIDGQQRLGAIANLFSSQARSDISFDTSTDSWVLRPPEGRRWISGRDLMTLSVYTLGRIFGACWSVDDPEVNKLIRLSDAIKYYSVVIVTLDEACSVGYVVEAFVRLGSSGTPMDEEQLRNALKVQEELEGWERVDHS